MKTFITPLLTKNPNQLHEELLNSLPQHRGTLNIEGFREDPEIRVESSKTDIFIYTPDSVTQAKIDSVVNSHSPKPIVDHRENALQKLKVSAGLTDKELNTIG